MTIDLEAKLVERKLITLDQLVYARLEAERSGRSVWHAFVKMGFLSEENITRFLASEAGVPYVKLSDYKLQKAVLNLLDESFCRANSVIPVLKDGNNLVAACGNPFDTIMLDTVGKITGCLVEPVMASASSISQALDYYWRLDTLNFDIADLVSKQEPVKGMMFWRESERVKIDWPVCVNLEDDSISLAGAGAVDGMAYNLTRDGLSVGVSLSVYLPKGARVALKIYPAGAKDIDVENVKICEAAGRVVNSYASNNEYFAGIKFIDMADTMKEYLIRKAVKEIKS